MTYPAYEAREVTPAVLDRPDLAQRWKRAAEHNLIKTVGGRYSAVLDADLARDLQHALPEVALYSYDDRDGSVALGFSA